MYILPVAHIGAFLSRVFFLLFGAACLPCLGEVEQWADEHGKTGEQLRQLHNRTNFENVQLDPVVQAHHKRGHQQNREVRDDGGHHHGQHVDHHPSLLRRLIARSLTEAGVGGAFLPKKPDQTAQTSEHDLKEEALGQADGYHNSCCIGVQGCKGSRKTQARHQKSGIWVTRPRPIYSTVCLTRTWCHGAECPIFYLPMATQKMLVMHHTAQDTAIRYSHFLEFRYSTGLATAK